MKCERCQLRNKTGQKSLSLEWNVPLLVLAMTTSTRKPEKQLQLWKVSRLLLSETRPDTGIVLSRPEVERYVAELLRKRKDPVEIITIERL